MKRTVVHAFVFSFLLMLLYVGVQIGLGVYHTLTYTPNIINAYPSNDGLQHKVAFGYIVRPYGLTVELICVMLAGMILYAAGRFLFGRFVKRK